MKFITVIIVGALIGISGVVVGFTIPQISLVALIVCSLIAYIEIKTGKK